MGSERQTPTEVSRCFAEAINAGDLNGAIACWSTAAVTVEPDGSEVRGHAEIKDRFRLLISVGAQLQISVSDEISSERGATATTRMTMTVPTGDELTVSIVGSAVVTYAPGPGDLQIRELVAL